MKSNPFFHLLPCLRCGRDSVVVSLLGGLERRETLQCQAPDCGVDHHLEIRRGSAGIEVIYDRHTLRYPLEMYDPGDHPVVRMRIRARPPSSPSEDEYRGIITIYRRQKYFSPAHVRAIWAASDGRCHICGRTWRARDRSRTGWHIDHVIPNVGGGVCTERPDNFRVACARCNLQKGRGYTPHRVLAAVRKLVYRLTPRPPAKLPTARIRGHALT